jgi:CRP-like cAMP-binding protein
MEQFLHNLPIFHGVEISEIKSLLVFLTAQRKSYKKGEIILSEGETTDCIGVVLSGLAMLQLGDIWGNNSVLGSVRPGGTFAEAYVCLSDEPLMIHVVAAEDSEILFLNMRPVLEASLSPDSLNIRLMRNLLTISARKIMQFSRRILYTNPKTIRKRVMLFLTECVRRGGNHTFTISFNRQQLADYLGVDRTSLCGELSRMRHDGLLDYHKSTFTVHEHTRTD